jgi:hypothetical protein
MKKLYVLFLLALTASTATTAQPNPQYGGTNYTLSVPLKKFPNRLEVTYTLDEKVPQQKISIGCMHGTQAVQWSELTESVASSCSRVGENNMRVFVKLALCGAESAVEVTPKHVSSANLKDGNSFGNVLLLVRSNSLNWRNPFVNGRPFSVLKSGC